MAQKFIVDWNPCEPQIRFHNCRQNGILGHIDEALYGGAVGGGKTSTLCVDSILECCETYTYPINVGLFRKSLPEIYNTFVPEINKRIPLGKPPKGIAEFNESKHFYKFWNGNKILLCFGENLKQMEEDYQSVEFQYLGIDEAGHFTEEMFDFLRTRVRTPDPKVKTKMRLCANPGGVGHGWLKRNFVMKATPNTPFEEVIDFAQIAKDLNLPSTIIVPDKIVRRKIYIPSRVFDNKFIMDNNPEYLMKLYSIQDPQRRKQLMLGDWEALAGQYFEEWKYAIHTCDPFEIPKHWRRYRAIDWGYSPRPAVCLWFAVNEYGKVFCYRELIRYKTLEDEFGKELVKLSTYADGNAENIEWTVIDRSCARPNSETGKNVITNLIEAGVTPIFQSDSARVSGWLCCRKLLRVDKNDKSDIQFFRGLCPTTIETIPQLQRDENKPEDIDSDGPDDQSDAWRYFSKQYVGNAEPEQDEYKNLDPMSAMAWKQIKNLNQEKVVTDETLGGVY